MRAQDGRSDPAPPTGTPVKLAGTDESTARAREHPEPNGPIARTEPARVGLLPSIVGLLVSIIWPLQIIKRGLAAFAAGFRGATWEHKADETIKGDLEVFGEMLSSSDVHKLRLKPRIEPLLQSQRYFLRSEAAVKAIANRVTWILCICTVAVPAVVVGLITPLGGEAVWLYFIELLGLAAAATWPTVVLRTLTGRYRGTLIWVALVLWASIAVAVLIVIEPGPSVPSDTIVVAVVCAATVLTIVLVARAYVVLWNEATLIYAWAEQRLEAAVVSMLLGVIWVLVEEPGKNRPPAPHVVQVLVEEPGEGGTPTPLQRSGTARALLAKAAAAVNNYLPRLIDGGRVYSADARATASEAAAFLLDLRSAVDLPNGRARKGDLAQLTKTVEDWSIGSLANLPRQTSPAADSQEAAGRRSGLLQVARKVVLGILPLILLLIAVTLLPLKMSAAITAALAPFAVTWLLLAIASILTPDVQMNFKNLFKG